MQTNDLAMLGGILSFLSLFLIVMLALTIVARWKMFTKAGEAGWKSLIPIYCDYTLFKLVWNAKSFWIYTASIVASLALNIIGGQYEIVGGQLVATGGGNFVIGIFAYLAGIVTLVYTVISSIKTALAYGKSPLFGAGILLLPGIFNLILGFGKAEYQGPQA